MALVSYTAAQVKSDATGGQDRDFQKKLFEVLSAADFGVSNTINAFIKVKRGPSGRDAFAFVPGFASETDRLGGFFYWDSDSATADNGVSVFLPSEGSGNGRWIRIGYTVDSSGNVGIGTASPIQDLDIRRSETADLGLWNTANSVRGFITSGTLNFTINRSGGAAIDFTSGGDINVSSGNVGIGTTSPDTKLDVNGPITFRERTADPADPDEGATVMWMSDGTGSGDDGDTLVKETHAGVTTTKLLSRPVRTIVVDASAGDGSQQLVAASEWGKLYRVGIQETVAFDGDTNKNFELGDGTTTDAYLTTTTATGTTRVNASLIQGDGDPVTLTWANNASASAGELTCTVRVIE